MTKEIRYKIGNRMRECRRKKKLSHEQLAETIDVACNTVFNIETGNKNASLENVVKSAQVFGLSLG